MARCLELAARGQSRVIPNPRVGAVIVSDEGTVLGEGWHQRFGDAHAEPQAIRAARERHGDDVLKSSTLYINLEPCDHQGKTPPCTGDIVRSGIPRVVAGMADPNPKAAGGAHTLRSQGVDVQVGILAHACRRLNEPFLHSLRHTRPLVTLKIALTLDGRIATASGHSKWITSVESRRHVHALRADHDGILIGRGTALADNPSLTVRHVEGLDPKRFVVDREGSLPRSLTIFNDGHPTTQVTGEDVPSNVGPGGTVLQVPVRDGHIDLEAALLQMGVHSLLVEAGPGLSSALLEKDLVDRLYCYIAPKVLGGGKPAITGLTPDSIADAITFVDHQWEPVGVDLLFRGYLRAV